jgi:DNA-directed RNA polymerase specialized sigma24 family protein
MEAGTLQPYMRRVLTNLVRDHGRATARLPRLSPLYDDDLAHTTSPLDTMIAAQLIARYRDAVARLSPRERTALQARIERGLGYDEVAKCAKCASSGAARVMVGRAMARVEAELRGVRSNGRASEPARPRRVKKSERRRRKTSTRAGHRP